MKRLVILASVVILAAGSAACARDRGSDSSSSTLGPTALDARGGGGGGGGGKPSGGSGSLTLKMVTDTNGNGLPNWNEEVTFTISTTATTEPFVDLACYKSGVLVYGTTAGFFDSYPWPWTKVMRLASPSWQGGAADCKAVLYYFSGKNNVVLGSTSFTAYE